MCVFLCMFVSEREYCFVFVCVYICNASTLSQYSCRTGRTAVQTTFEQHTHACTAAPLARGAVRLAGHCSYCTSSGAPGQLGPRTDLTHLTAHAKYTHSKCSSRTRTHSPMYTCTHIHNCVPGTHARRFARTHTHMQTHGIAAALGRVPSLFRRLGPVAQHTQITRTRWTRGCCTLYTERSGGQGGRRGAKHEISSTRRELLYCANNNNGGHLHFLKNF